MPVILSRNLKLDTERTSISFSKIPSQHVVTFFFLCVHFNNVFINVGVYILTMYLLM